MAKKNKPSLFKRILQFFWKKRNPAISINAEIPKPKSFDMEWKKAQLKWNQLLLTKSVEQGLVVERSGYKLHKTNDKLFRLEGNDFSILIATGNTIYTNKDGKLAGIIFVEEGNLNQAIQSDYSKLEDFLTRLNLPKADLNFELGKLENWKIILNWERFWKEQLLLQLSANTTAILLLALGDEMNDFFTSVATDRQKTLVRDEFFFLNSGKTGEANYPHGKNKNFFGFSGALSEFSNKIDLIQKKRDKEIGIPK